MCNGKHLVSNPFSVMHAQDDVVLRSLIYFQFIWMRQHS